ncbi:MAG: Multi antimicrobial extrusion protein [Labilithrix sp.]|nr:Multi antimicrobial extrusion protein [Labilithrix sp.]
MPTADPPQTLWSAIREAIRGTEQDLTAVPIRRAVLLLAVPTVLEMSMESLLAIVDIVLVSRLGEAAVAAVGLTESILSIVYALAMGLATAATATVARRIGEKDPEGAARAAVQVIFAAIAIAIVTGAAGAAFAPELLRIMGAGPEVIATGSSFAALMIGGNFTIFLLFVVNAVFRSAGDAAVAMRSLWLANILNIILAPVLIYGLHMGVLGAAVATTSARAVGVAYQLVLLARGRGRLKVLARHLRVHLEVLVPLLRLAMTGALQVLVETASWLGLVRIVSSYGSTALAGYTIAMRISIFAMLPSWGLSGAAATLVGQNLGAKQPARAESSVLTIAAYNAIGLGLAGLLFAIFPHAIVGLVSNEPGVVAEGSSGLRIVALGYLSFAVGMVAIQAFNGAGDTVTPMLVNVACFWLFKIPLAWALSHGLGLGPRGVFIAITDAYTAQGALAAFLFRRGRWKTARVA